MMAPLVWSDQYRTGVGFIDESHEQIFRLINILEMPERGAEESSPEAAMELFLDYTGRHFREEEELMLFLDFPGYEAHKADHEKAVAWIRVLQAEAQEGLLSLKAVSQFAALWVTTHIQEQDFPFIQWTRESRSSKAMDSLLARGNRA